MLRELRDRVGGLDVLRALYDKRFDMRTLHLAYLGGPDALRALMEQRGQEPLSDAATWFLAGYRKRSVARVQQQLEAFVEYCGPGATLADLTPEKIDGFLLSLKTGDATRNRYRASVSALCSALVRARRLVHHPMAYRAVAVFHEGARRLPDLTPDEYRGYLDAIENPAVRLVAAVLMGTGADVGEVIGTRLSDGSRSQPLTVAACDFDRALPRLRFRRSKVRSSLERMVPITDALRDALAEHIRAYNLSGDDELFPMVTDMILRKAHETARKVIGKPNLRRKDLRHIAAIYWRRGGADLESVRQWLGHSNIAQTVIYAAFGADDTYDAPAIANLSQKLRLIA
jgi:integrase